MYIDCTSCVGPARCKSKCFLYQFRQLNALKLHFALSSVLFAVSVYLVQLRVIAQGIVVGALALTAGIQMYKRITHSDDVKK